MVTDIFFSLQLFLTRFHNISWPWTTAYTYNVYWFRLYSQEVRYWALESLVILLILSHNTNPCSSLTKSSDVHKRCIGNTSFHYCQCGYSNMELLTRRPGNALNVIFHWNLFFFRHFLYFPKEDYMKCRAYKFISAWNLFSKPLYLAPKRVNCVTKLTKLSTH